jgi:hypothetical protein
MLSISMSVGAFMLMITKTSFKRKVMVKLESKKLGDFLLLANGLVLAGAD